MKFIKALFIFILLLITFFFSFIKSDIGSVVFVILTIFFTLILYSNNIEIIEILGAKFKLKEINNSINELKELSKTVAAVSLDLLQRSNRWYDKNFEYIKIDFFNQIDKILSNINIPKAEKIYIYDKYWHKWVIYDYTNKIHGEMEKLIDDSKVQEKEYLISLCKPHTCTSLIKAFNTAKKKGTKFSPKLITRIEDFEYYLSNKTHKSVKR